jgi:hypothetical protein
MVRRKEERGAERSIGRGGRRRRKKGWGRGEERDERGKEKQTPRKQIAFSLIQITWQDLL